MIQNFKPRSDYATRAPKSVSAEGVPPDKQKDWHILWGNGKPQHIIFINVPYINHNGKEKFIVGAVYNVVRKTLPSRLPALLPPLQGSPAYAIRDIPGKGKGIITTRDIALGEIVIVERPVLVYPLMMYMSSLAPFREYAKFSMDSEDWEEYHNLVNARDIEENEFDGIKGSNAFTIRLKHGREDYGGVFLELSRLNHSCGPNLLCSWTTDLFILSAQAVRPIRAGEELTVAYTDVCDPHADRRFHLQRHYDFDCECGYCTKTSSSSDKDRIVMQPDSSSSTLEVIYSKLLKPGMPRPVARPYASQLSRLMTKDLAVIAKEGIESSSALWYYVYMMKTSGILGDRRNFQKWGFKAVLMSMKYMELDGEEACCEVERWIDWVREPEKFPYWGRFQ